MGFSMNVSDAEEIKKEVVEEVKPSSEEVNKLKKLSNSNVEAIMNINMDSLYERKEILKSIDEFGLDTIQRSSQNNERFRSKYDRFYQEGAFWKGIKSYKSIF